MAFHWLNLAVHLNFFSNHLKLFYFNAMHSLD
ncbi:hypothetical protein T10_6455 [Trichinella papuae]|uniref:Uncharacterized protein n=1 Tax=Trichinella papuae TaxID=268474 RepID=A0A0V1LY78_9BILA|nr:hypothetical protein T10_6455 [Trichinella papuae]